jgi:hypothetical protein
VRSHGQIAAAAELQLVSGRRCRTRPAAVRAGPKPTAGGLSVWRLAALIPTKNADYFLKNLSLAGDGVSKGKQVIDQKE